MRLVNQHEYVGPFVDLGGHAAELVDGGNNDAPIVALEQIDQCVHSVGVFHIVQPQCRQILAHLVFQFVAVHHQQDGGLVTCRSLEQPLCGLDHREGFAAALSMPDQPARAFRIQAAADYPLHSSGLVLGQDVLVEFFVFFSEDDKVLE